MATNDVYLRPDAGDGTNGVRLRPDAPDVGGVTAFLAWTEENDVTAVSVALSQNVTLAWTEENDATAVNVGVGQNATLAWTEDDDVTAIGVTVSAAVPVTVDLAWTEDDDQAAITASVASSQTYGATNYLRALRKRHKLPEPAQDFTAAVARALEIELRLKAEKRQAEQELAEAKKQVAKQPKTQGDAPEKVQTTSNSDFVAKRELLRYKIRQYEAELDSIRSFEIGARLLALQTERQAAAQDAQDMEDILMILALDEA